MTEYHDYNIPDEGEPNWHEPLNENFQMIDNDVEVRDSDANLDEYDAIEGAKYMATDNGRMYIGDGDEWNYVPSSANDALLREGYIVAETGGRQVTVDPSDYDDAGEALQLANDNLLNEMASGEYGQVYFPPVDSDNEELTISSSVSFGDTGDKTVLPVGWGFRGPNVTLNCQIDDGSPMFHVRGDLAGNSGSSVQATSFGYFNADADGNDAEFLRLSNINAFTLLNTHARHFNTSSAAGVYVFDGHVYNSHINNTSYVQTTTDCPDTDVWVVVNDTNDGPPGELKFGEGNSTYAASDIPFNTVYKQTIDCKGILYNGRVEGAGGPALIYVTDGDFKSSCMEMGRHHNRNGTETHKLYFEGTKLALGNAVVADEEGNEGDLIHIAGGEQIRIAPFKDATANGHSINIVSDGGGSNVWVVPYKESLKGSVNYPETPWSATRYTDGWQKHQSGTTTISPSDTTVLTEWAGKVGTEIKLANRAIASDPGSDVEYQEIFGYSQNTDRQTVKVKELAGTEFELSWEVHRRDKYETTKYD